MKWTEDKIRILKENYPNETKKKILELLPDLKWDSIRVKASLLKISRANFKNKFQVGSNNPKYIDGRANKKYYCKCGREKDYRAKICLTCRNFNYSKEFIENIVQNSTSYKEVSEKINENRQTITRFIEANYINISHFKSGRERLDSLDKIFCISDKIRRGKIRKAILDNNLKEYTCSNCNLEPIWQQEPLVLQIDHINGNPRDNRLENLRFLCPNCHSQTTTFTGKNTHGTKPRKEK